jgi:hypothetical protein
MKMTEGRLYIRYTTPWCNTANKLFFSHIIGYCCDMQCIIMSQLHTNYNTETNPRGIRHRSHCLDHNSQRLTEFRVSAMLLFTVMCTPSHVTQRTDLSFFVTWVTRVSVYDFSTSLECLSDLTIDTNKRCQVDFRFIHTQIKSTNSINSLPKEHIRYPYIQSHVNKSKQTLEITLDTNVLLWIC